MEKILICPGDRPAVGFLAQSVPLVAAPILGGNLITCWLEALADAGVKDILILVTDRPELVRSTVGDGSRWGVRARVEAELTELTAAAACARFAAGGTNPDAVVLDHLPGVPALPLFRSYRDWFGGILSWMARSAHLNRIGVRELAPGVWCGRGARVASTARLTGPCWLGDQVSVGADAVIGPNAVLEHRVVVDAAAEVSSSVVGPDTYVGGLTRIDTSIAWGSTLINWSTGSCTQVPDSFLLCALGQRYLPALPSRLPTRTRRGLSSWLGRLGNS